MSKKRKPKMEFRYYKMPEGSHLRALLGTKWVQEYGREIDYLHFHNYLEIGYCYKGNGILTLGEEDLQFSGDQFTVIPKSYPHTTNSNPGEISRWEYLFVDVEGLFGELSSNISASKKAERLIQRIHSRAILRSVKDSPKMGGLIRQILDIMRDTEEFYVEEATGLTAALLMNIARENEVEEWKSPDEMEGKMTLLISNALDYITLHYMEPLKIEDLAKWCHISETHFRRTFINYMKMSPLEYINLVRIQTACEYLKKTDDSVADIAHKCGFFTTSTFNRNFKQLLGISPTEWRKRPENYEQQLLKFEIHTEKGW